MRVIRLCRDQAIKVELPDVLQLMEDVGVDKFYLSQQNYAGRGNPTIKSDAHPDTVWWHDSPGNIRERRKGVTH